MKSKIILVIILSVAVLARAQVIKFVVKDTKTNLPIEGVEVFSHELHDKITYSSKKGLVKFDVRRTDTLVFYKKNFSPFYLQIRHDDFDTLNHVIHLKMKQDEKSLDHKLPTKFSQLDKSSYEFPTDSLANNKILITRYEVPDSDPAKDRSFHFVEIRLDEKSNRRSPFVRR